MVVLRPLALLLLAGLVGAGLRFAAAEERSLRELVQGYESHLVDREEWSYDGQREVLERIAALRTDEARATLLRLLSRYGDADRRRTALLLGALVRYGGPKEMDRAIQHVESRKDPILVDLLHAIVAEAQMPHARAHLRGDALRSATPRVKAQIARALGQLRDRDAVKPLLELVREKNLLVRIEGLEALGRVGDRQARPFMQIFLQDEDAHVRAAAARGLGLLGDRGAVTGLLRVLDDASPRVVEAAATALGALGDPRAIPPLIALLERLQDVDLRVADAATQALQAISGKAIHADAELWRAWWAVAGQKKPFRKAAEKPGRRTVPGPSYYGFPVRSSKVVFVLDVSRSMGWNERLESAQRELIGALEKLPRTTRFNVIVYSDQAFAWKSGLTPAKSAAVKRAVAFVRSQKPLNGTNTYAALAKAFQDPEADTFFFLSDGHPSVGRITDPDLILMRVRDWNRLRRVRVHGIALLRGEPPAAFRSLEDGKRSLSFMQRLADQNGGRFRKIE